MDADGQARNLNAESVKKMRDAVERLFLAFCAKHGYRLLILLFEEEPRYLLKTDYKTLLRTAKKRRHRDQVNSGRSAATPTVRSMSSAVKAGPAENAPEEVLW